MKRYIRATSDSDSLLNDKIDDIKADFDYIIDGLDKLSRMGLEKIALEIVEELDDYLVSLESKIAETILNWTMRWK